MQCVLSRGKKTCFFETVPLLTSKMSTNMSDNDEEGYEDTRWVMRADDEETRDVDKEIPEKPGENSDGKENNDEDEKEAEDFLMEDDVTKLLTRFKNKTGGTP